MEAAPNRIRAIGEPALLAGYGLCGVEILAARTDEETHRAWAGLPQDTAVVVLTPEAARALKRFSADEPAPMTVVLPS